MLFYIKNIDETYQRPKHGIEFISNRLSSYYGRNVFSLNSHRYYVMVTQLFLRPPPPRSLPIFGVSIIKLLSQLSGNASIKLYSRHLLADNGAYLPIFPYYATYRAISMIPMLPVTRFFALCYNWLTVDVV